jgi:hypothetical protein
LYIEKSRRHKKVSLTRASTRRRNAIGSIRSQIHDGSQAAPHCAFGCRVEAQDASALSKFVTLLFTDSSQIRGALKPRQTRPQKPEKKDEKKLKKKLATAVAIGLDRALQGQMGLSSVQKKMKKKLVRIQEV